MARSGGIIYGTQALYRWSSAYPNGRFIVVGLLMFAGLPFPLLWWFGGILDLVNLSSPQQVDIASTALAGAMAIIVAVHLAGMWIFICGINRIAIEYSSKQLVKPPVPNPDTPPERT